MEKQGVHKENEDTKNYMRQCRPIQLIFCIRIEMFDNVKTGRSKNSHEANWLVTEDPWAET